ncbi:MAG TPA: UpxY family transcription antiterminator [Puia sp.]|jgi:transcription antitermination factor NusG|nr:UpxY family transcription antiterminator [Puia sp.]
MANFFKDWFLIYTKPRQENKVYERLTESGIEAFLPKRPSLRLLPNKRKCFIVTPLFPSYIFVNLKGVEDYYFSQTIDGYSYYVRMGKDIVKVNKTVVDNLKIIVENKEYVEMTESHFIPGQKMVITEGPLTGLKCEVVSYEGNRKLLVRVNILKRNLIISMQPDCVMADVSSGMALS